MANPNNPGFHTQQQGNFAPPIRPPVSSNSQTQQNFNNHAGAVPQQYQGMMQPNEQFQKFPGQLPGYQQGPGYTARPPAPQQPNMSYPQQNMNQPPYSYGQPSPRQPMTGQMNRPQMTGQMSRPPMPGQPGLNTTAPPGPPMAPRPVAPHIPQTQPRPGMPPSSVGQIPPSSNTSLPNMADHLPRPNSAPQMPNASQPNMVNGVSSSQGTMPPRPSLSAAAVAGQTTHQQFGGQQMNGPPSRPHMMKQMGPRPPQAGPPTSTQGQPPMSHAGPPPSVTPPTQGMQLNVNNA